jgi:hypothetical protein
MARAYPINSSAAAVTEPGVNDYDLTRVITEFMEEGVIRGFGVTQRGAGANMSVDIAAGIAVIEITNTNVSHGKTTKTWFEETITTNKPITTADPTNPRKDRVVLRIDVSTDPDVSAANIAIIEVIAGTPAGSPSAPAEPSNAITLAIVDIPASDTTISTGQITDSRTYVTLDPLVLADVQREATALKTTRFRLADFTELTIASGAITVTQTIHTVDTESNAASDDLDTITAAYGVGEIIHLTPDNTARTIVVKHNTGNILLADGADFSMDTSEKSITLIRKGSSWHEFARGGPTTPVVPDFDVRQLNGTAGSAVGSGVNTEVNASPNFPIGAGDFTAVGQKAKVDYFGKVDVDGTTDTIRVKIGSSTVATFTMSSGGTTTNLGFHIEVTITCRATGGSGSVQVSSKFVVDSPTGTTIQGSEVLSQSFDTTAINTVQLSSQFGNTNAGNGLTVNDCSGYYLKNIS